MTRPPKVIIVGRANVGKSTLFNRLIEEQKSLVSDIPGTTRDRYEGDCIWRGKAIRLVDTGGLDVGHADEIEADIAEQARLAIQDGDLLLFVVDLKAGIQPADRDLGKELMRSKKPVIVVGNKADTNSIAALANEKEWHRWGLPAPMPVSASRGTNTGDLMDEIFDTLKEHKLEPVEISDIAVTRVTVIGKPNVGKSSLLNSLIGEKRYIASPKAHTTREPNDTFFKRGDRSYLFVDTAGVRKQARVASSKSKLEKAGVARTLKAVTRSDVVLFVIDIAEPLNAQDLHLAGQIAEAGASAVIVANKWDLIPEKDTNTINKYTKYLRANLPMLDYAPIEFTSALTKKRVENLFETIDRVYQSRFTQLDLEETKSFISRAIKRHKPSRGKGVAHPRIMSFIQSSVNPPLFDLKIRSERKDALAESYLRFLENLIRKYYDFEGTPIRIRVLAKRKKHTT